MNEEHASNVIAFGGNTMVYESTKRFALRNLNELMRVLMENVDDSLFALSEKVENDYERTLYFDAMRELRKKRQSLVESFDEEMQRSFADLIRNRKAMAQAQQLEELSLVDEAEFEDRIAIDNMISKARPYFEDDLFAVSERLKVILHRKEIDQNLNPLDPKSICESFHIAASVMETDIKVKLIFYKMFDKFVMAKLGRFYQELNDHLIDKGVLPQFNAERERLNRTTQFKTRSSSSESNNSLKSETTGTTDDNDSGGQGNVLNLLQRMLGGDQGSSASSGAGQAADVGSSGSGQVNGIATGQTGASAAPGTANVYIPALTQLQGNFRYSNESVMDIDPRQLQTDMQQHMMGIRQQYHASGSEVDSQIIDIVSMLFDFFFDDQTLPDPIKVLIGRLQIPILKVAMLDREFFNLKKHPARKLLDNISRASMGWSDDQQNEKRLIEKIESIVNLLLDEFEDDIGVFETALTEFEAFLQQENQQASQSINQLKSREHHRELEIQQARETVDKLIYRILKKHELDYSVSEFLQTQWKSVLLSTYLSQGKDSIHWKNLRKITSVLLWSLIAKETEQDKAKLLKTLPALLRALSRAMEYVGIEVARQNEVFQMLVSEHARVMKQTTHNIVTRVDDMTIWPTQSHDSDLDQTITNLRSNPDDEPLDFAFETDDTGEITVVESDHQSESELLDAIQHSSSEEVVKPLKEFTDSVQSGQVKVDEEVALISDGLDSSIETADQSLLEQVKQMEIGSWVEFRLTEQDILNAQLSWKSNITGKCVFVNRHGETVRKLNARTLVEEMQKGMIRLLENESVFDRAIHSLLGRFN